MGLNLPAYDHKIIQRKEVLYIKDLVREKMLKLTPEEWVRQHYLNYLINCLHYPKGLINAEIGMNYHKNNKRADIVVYSNFNGNPLIVIECKAPFIEISAKTMQQASVYYSQLQPKFLVLTNGITHLNYFFQPILTEIDTLPDYYSFKNEE